MSNKTPQGSTNRQAGDVAAITVRKDPTGKRQRENEVWKRIAEEGTPTVLSHEWQKECCNDARTAGFIAFTHLAYILASDEQYEEILPCLWDKYELNKRGPKKPNVSTARERIGVWDSLLRRWAFGTVAGIADGLHDIPYLPVYSFDEEIGQLKPYDRQTMIGIGYVKLDELNKYCDGFKVPLPSLLYSQPAKETTSADDFIKKLRVKVENESEITIQVPRKPPITYHCRDVGFRDERVRGWKLLKETLREEPHIIKRPPKKIPGGGYNREYDRERKVLTRLNEVLVDFFTKKFPISIPEGYKVYERYRADGPGALILKFKAPGVILSCATNGFKAMPKEKLVEEIHSLCKKYCETKEGKMHDYIELKIVEASTVAKKKGWITEERLEELLTGPEDIEASVETIFEEAQKKTAPSTKSYHPCE